MKLQTIIQAVPADTIQEMRQTYLHTLMEAQELFLEVLIADSLAFQILEKKSKKAIGYVIIKNETLLEYYLIDEYIQNGEYLLKEIIERLDVTETICKSFDHFHFASALPYQDCVEVMGLLSREYEKKPLPERGISFTERIATEDDFRRIMQIEQDVFYHEERLKERIRNEELLLFENENELYGFGIIQPVPADKPTADVGIVIDKPYRMKGHAMYIMQRMMDYCVENGIKPIAGCAQENVLSRRMGERIGMISNYRLFKMKFSA